MGDLKDQSRRLSWLLRFGAGEVGLAMDAAGWAAVEDVLGATGLSRAELVAVVGGNDKQRFQVEGIRIRAAQGHGASGMPVTREALEASWAPFSGDGPVYHGTNREAAYAIAREGIHAGGRTHVHLAPATDSHVGKRARVEVLLAVSPARLRAAGLTVYESPNGVVLVREVPAACVLEVQCLTRRARAEEAALRQAFGL